MGNVCTPAHNGHAEGGQGASEQHTKSAGDPPHAPSRNGAHRPTHTDHFLGEEATTLQRSWEGEQGIASASDRKISSACAHGTGSGREQVVHMWAGGGWHTIAVRRLAALEGPPSPAARLGPIQGRGRAMRTKHMPTRVAPQHGSTFRRPHALISRLRRSSGD